MNEQAFEDLYNLFVGSGYKKSKEDFVLLMNENGDAYNDAFELFKNAGYKKGEDEFATLIGIGNPLKKKEETLQPKEETVQPNAQSVSTDLSSEDGSLASAESPEAEDPYDRMMRLAPEAEATSLGAFETDPETGYSVWVKPEYVPSDTRESTYRPPPMLSGGYVAPEHFGMYQEAEANQMADQMYTFNKILEEAPALEAQKKVEAIARAQEKTNEEKIRIGNIESEGFQNALSSISSNLIDKEEDVVVPELTRLFDGYGFIFQETGIGDAMLVAAPNGKTITIDLDPFTTSTEVAESRKLRSFMLANTTLKPADAPEGFVLNAMRAKQLRDVARDNGNGTESTVLFASYEEDGKFKVIPTLFPKDRFNYTSRMGDWTEPSFDKAKAMAEQRGEVFVFDTEEEAENFAQGSWKDVSTHEAEAIDFYAKRGIDYNREKKLYLNEGTILCLLDKSS